VRCTTGAGAGAGAVLVVVLEREKQPEPNVAVARTNPSDKNFIMRASLGKEASLLSVSCNDVP
jgi:hypothetical protein